MIKRPPHIQHYQSNHWVVSCHISHSDGYLCIQIDHNVSSLTWAASESESGLSKSILSLLFCFVTMIFNIFFSLQLLANDGSSLNGLLINNWPVNNCRKSFCSGCPNTRRTIKMSIMRSAQYANKEKMF